MPRASLTSTSGDIANELTRYLPHAATASPATKEAAAALHHLLSEEQAELDAVVSGVPSGSNAALPRKRLSLGSVATVADDEAEQARQRVLAKVEKSHATVKEKLFVFGQSPTRPSVAEKEEKAEASCSKEEEDKA